MDITLKGSHKSREIARFIVSAFIFLIFSNAACAADYYVATYGNNDDTGLSLEHAWTTPSYAVKQAVAGDTIYLVNGIWYNDRITFPKSGNATHPITLTAYNGTPTLQGIDYSGSPMNMNYKDHIKINGIKINGYGNGIIHLGSYTNISNCDIGNLSSIALEMSGHGHGGDLHDIWIVENKIHDIAMTGDTGPNMINICGSFVHLGESVTYNIFFINNDIYGKALHQVINIQSCNPPVYANIGLKDMTFRGNTIHNLYADGNAFYTIYGTAENITIENNVIKDFQNHGIKGCFSNSTFIGNEISNLSAYYGIYFDNIGVFNNNNLIKNNTIFDTDGVRLEKTFNNTIIENYITEYYAPWNVFTVTDSTKNPFDTKVADSTITTKFTDNRVFKISKISANPPYEIINPLYYTDKSNGSITDLGGGSDIVRITTYPMTARPTTDPATITVNKFDTSLSQGSTLISFTADTTDGNNVVFTVSDLQPNHNYLVKKDGADFTTRQANSSGYIQFSNSEWSEHTFTIEETTSGDLPPTASAGPDRTVSPSASITFDGSSSSDDYGITSYLWDFGDSQQNTGAVVTHTYDTAGTYTVTLTVTDTGGNTDSDTAVVTVSEANHAPVLAPIDSKSVDEGNTLSFTLSATDADGDGLTYSATDLPTGASLDVTSGAFIWTPSDGQAGTHEITFVVSDGYLTDSEAVTITVNEAIEQPVLTVIDNRLRESTPDSVLGDSTWIDVGRIDSIGNYRSTIWFDLSQFNSTDHIEKATLSLFWYYESRNQSTDVGIYRPANWDADYVTWNTRTNGVAWNNPGGDWYDKNNAAQGAEPYAAVTFPVDTPPDYLYHDFDVTELVQSYINGAYDNTGFFIKANEIDNSYIAFYSSDWSNTSQRPKLSITNTPEAGPVNHAPVLATIGDKSVDEGSTRGFTLSATDADGDSLTYSADGVPDGASLDSASGVFTWTPAEGQAGTYVITFVVSDGYLTDSAIVTITVNGAPVEVTLTLYEGWNLVALPVINDGFTASSLASAIGDVSYVMKRNASDGGYQDYIVGFSGDADDFVISPDEGYYVYLDVVQKDITISGTQPGTRSIDLTEGWNLVGWTSLDPSDAVAAFVDPLGGKIKYAAKRISPYGEYENYVAGFSDPEDNFDVEPGYGYFVFVTSDCTWTHD